jgi:hypothetical protein
MLASFGNAALSKGDSKSGESQSNDMKKALVDKTMAFQVIR